MLLKKQAGALGIGQCGVIKELLKKSLLLVRGEFGCTPFTRSRAEVALLALQLQVAPDGARADGIALGYVCDVFGPHGQRR
jgi:hypothetical protein